jgi:hypothetical protein
VNSTLILNLLMFAIPTRKRPIALCALGACITCLAPSTARAQARWYVSAIGSDTLTLERFERAGNTITGVWVTFHNGTDRHREILRHEYTIALAAHDRPRSVHLLLRHPGHAVEFTYDAQFTDDTVFISAGRDTVQRHSIGAHRAYPLLGGSVAMFEAVIAAARSERHVPDSTTIVAVPITGPFIATPIPITLLSANAVRFGPAGGPTLYTDMRGALDSVAGTNGQVPLRRAAPFDIDAVALAAQQALQRPAVSPSVHGAEQGGKSDAGPARAPRFAGRRDGALDVGGTRVRLALDLRDSSGTLIGTMVRAPATPAVHP